MNDCLFIETMRVVNGEIANLQCHIDRMCRTVNEVYGTVVDVNKLRDLAVPDNAEKCRLVYGKQIESIEFGSYKPRQIDTLKLVEADADLDYHLKYANREALTHLHEQRGECDDVLIAKNGFITDTSYTNVVFTDGERFVTPDTYLLPGTMRANLLKLGNLVEAPISVNDIKKFTHIALINAMLPLGRLPLIPTSHIL